MGGSLFFIIKFDTAADAKNSLSKSILDATDTNIKTLVIFLSLLKAFTLSYHLVENRIEYYRLSHRIAYRSHSDITLSVFAECVFCKTSI